MSKINGITYGTYPSIRPKKNVDKSVCENCEICKSKKYQLADSLERMHICRDSGCNNFYFSKTITKDENGKYCIGLDTKTQTGRRTIHLSDIALKYLNECIAHSTKNKFNLLFYNPENSTGGFYVFMPIK